MAVAVPIEPALCAALALLAGFLVAAVWQDVRTRRIPNRLVLVGTLAGLVLNGALPLALSQTVARPGGLGWLASFEGMALGLVLLLPLYALKTLGAGDVKLLAMVGAFVGPHAVLGVLVATLVAGGVLAVAFALRFRVLGALLRNVGQVLQTGLRQVTTEGACDFGVSTPSLGNLPYSVAIAAGTAVYLAWHRGTVSGGV